MANNNITSTVTITVNAKQANKMLDDQKKKAEDLRKEIDRLANAQGDHRKEIEKLDKELRQTERLMRQLRTESAQTTEVLKRLDKATPKELNKALNQLKRELNNIERGSKAWDEQIEKIKRVKAELDRVNSSMRVTQSSWERFKDKFNDWSGIAMAAAASLTGVVVAAKAAVTAFADMDQEMANVRKYTGMTAEQVAELNEEFKKMDTRTSREDLNKLAQEAGRLGKSSIEDVLGFVRAADKINVALDDLGEGATLTLSKLTGIFGDEQRLGTEKALLSVGSVINELSQNCTASAPYLAEFASRMGGVGAQAGMTVQQILAFGAVLDSNNQKVEASATALSQVMVRIYQDPAKYANVAGIDVKKFADLVKTDMNGALMLLLETLGKAGKMDTLSPMFKDMGENGSRAISALSTLAGHIEEVRKQQEVANEAFEEATSIDIEFNVQNETLQASLEKAKNRLNEMAVSLGEKLAPVMQHVISSTTLLLRVMSSVVDFLVKYKNEIIVVASGIAAYTLAVKAATIATNIQKAATIAATTAMKALNLVTKASPWGLLAAAITATATAIALLGRKTDATTKAMKELNRVKDEATKKSEQRRISIENLVKAAESENTSLEKRKAIIDKLNNIIPGYNAHLDETSGKYIANKKALDSYLVSLAKKYELEGAEERLKELGRRKAEINIELTGATSDLQNATAAEQADYARRSATRSPGTLSVGSTASAKRGIAQARVDRLNAALKEVIAQESLIFKSYGQQLQDQLIDSFLGEGEGEGGASGAGGSGGGSSSKGDKFAAVKEWREQMRAIALIAYRTGKSDYNEYMMALDQIEVEYYEKMLEHADLGETEKLTLMAESLTAQDKLLENARKKVLADEESDYKRQKSELDQFYLDNQISKEAHDIKLEELELEHQRRMIEIMEEGSPERLAAEDKYAQLLMAQKERLAKEEEQRLAQIMKYKDKYFGDNPSEKQAKYDDAISWLELAFGMEMDKAGGDSEQIEILKQKLDEAKKLIYDEIFGTSEEDGFKGAILKSAEWLQSEGGQALTQSMSMVISQMGAIFSQLTSYIEAETQIQTAAINKRYDAEISRAQGNSRLVARIEKQKEKEIAKVKSEANKKMFAMQVIQAIAQTAQNAINAYGSAAAIPIVGHIMAPIAAATAVAAGMVQVAAIKKQQQAADSEGYAEGGYTRPGSKYQVAGVVHAGEWVASQQLVNNPVTAPIIGLLEQAQRSNSFASLSSSEAGIISGSPAATTLALSAASASVDKDLALSIQLLIARLNEPFATINTMDGPFGIKEAQDDYYRYINNKNIK